MEPDKATHLKSICEGVSKGCNHEMDSNRRSRYFLKKRWLVLETLLVGSNVTLSTLGIMICIWPNEFLMKYKNPKTVGFLWFLSCLTQAARDSVDIHYTQKISKKVDARNEYFLLDEKVRSYKTTTLPFKTDYETELHTCRSFIGEQNRIDVKYE
jgi:hypothetical protein